MPRPSPLFLGAILGVLLLGILMRLQGAAQESLWIDEVMSADFADRASHFNMKWLAFADVHPPGYFLLLDGWSQIFGSSAEALRSLSILMGTLTLLFLMWPPACRRGSQSGWHLLLVGMVLALHAGHIHYSQEVRSYALLALWALIFMRQLITLNANPGRRNAIICILVGAAGLWIHHFAWVFWAGALAGIFLLGKTGERSRPWLAIAFGGAACLAAPWIPVTIHQMTGLPEGFTAHLQQVPAFSDLSRVLGPWGGLDHDLVAMVGFVTLLGIFALFLNVGVEKPEPRTVETKQSGDPAKLWFYLVPALAGVLSLTLVPILPSSSLQRDLLAQTLPWAPLLALGLVVVSFVLLLGDRLPLRRPFEIEGAVAVGALLAVSVAMATGRLGQARNALPLVPLLLAAIAWRPQNQPLEQGQTRNPILLVALLIAMPVSAFHQSSRIDPRPDFRGAIELSQAQGLTRIHVIPGFDTPAVQRAAEDLQASGLTIGPWYDAGGNLVKGQAHPDFKAQAVIFSRLKDCSQIPATLEQKKRGLSDHVLNTPIHALRRLCISVPPVTK